jgi:hypothetical protein
MLKKHKKMKMKLPLWDEEIQINSTLRAKPKMK